jgi:hypothetical protein
LERLRQFLNNPRASIREALSTARAITILEADLDRAREVLSNKTASFVVQLQDAVGVQLAAKPATYAFFGRILNYAPHKAAVPLKHETHLDYFVCDSLLECHRDHLRLDDYSVQVLTLKEPPAQTFAHLLGALQEIPSNAVIVSEWKRESNFRIRKEINAKRRHFHNSKTSLTNYVASQNPNPQEMLIDDAAAALVADLGGRLRELEVSGNYFGQFSFTIILYDLERAKLRRSVAECFKVFSTHDAVLTRGHARTLPGDPDTVAQFHRLQYLRHYRGLDWRDQLRRQRRGWLPASRRPASDLRRRTQQRPCRSGRSPQGKLRQRRAG